MVYNYFGAPYNTSDKINQDCKETATQTVTHVNNREEHNHPALVKNNELPFIRRAVYTRTSGTAIKREGVTSGRLLSHLIAQVDIQSSAIIC